MKQKTILKDEAFLRQISKPVDFGKENWKEALKQLDAFCRSEKNVMAMAAIQLGIPLRMVYLKKTNLERLEEDYNEKTVLINPVVLKKEGLTTYWEACASCLDYTALVERPYRVEIEYFNQNGEQKHTILEGFPATVCCHELDHLDGIFHMDIASHVLQMNLEERKKWRKSHPYQIIRKKGPYK